jgi:hypothetical protein
MLENMKCIIFTLNNSYDEFENYFRSNVKLLSNSLIESNWKKSLGNSKNKLVISSKLKLQIDSLYSELMNCVKKNNVNNEKCHEIYLQLTYFLKTCILNNFMKEYI